MYVFVFWWVFLSWDNCSKIVTFLNYWTEVGEIEPELFWKIFTVVTFFFQKKYCQKFETKRWNFSLAASYIPLRWDVFIFIFVFQKFYFFLNLSTWVAVFFEKNRPEKISTWVNFNLTLFVKFEQLFFWKFLSKFLFLPNCKKVLLFYIFLMV